MTFPEIIKAKIGTARYAHIETEAPKEVALALQMPLKDQDNHDQYYSPRLMLREFQADPESSQGIGLPVLPVDLMHVLFRCRLLRAAQNEQKFQQRSGRPSLFQNRAILPRWEEKTMANSDLENQYVNGLETDIQERTLVSRISSLNSNRLGGDRHQDFFEDLFGTLAVPFVSFLDDDLIGRKYDFGRNWWTKGEEDHDRRV